jgi:hypothetical protein
MRALRFVLVALLALGCSPQGKAQVSDQKGPPTALAQAYRASRGPVEAEMRHVLYRVDDQVVLQIDYLRGALLPTTKAPPWFDDPTTFRIAIDTGEVEISPASLTALLNRYVFNYDGTPLKDLTVSIEDGELKQHGTLHKGVDLPFTIRTTLAVTPDGRLRLHPTSVKVLGIGVTGLMKTFGIELESLVKVQQGRGVEIEDDDFILAPSGLLPPPRIAGRLTAARLLPDAIAQTFGGSTREGHKEALHPSDPKARNYMFYRGRVLRFGKLTMEDADLQIVDADPDDPFDFSLAHLNQQLVAGSSRNQKDFGLVTTMPDYGDMLKKERERLAPGKSAGAQGRGGAASGSRAGGR